MRANNSLISGDLNVLPGSYTAGAQVLPDSGDLTYYADMGTGDSHLTWQDLAAINYRFQKVDAVVGYRYLKYDFDNSQVFNNLNLSGPFAGVKFRF